MLNESQSTPPRPLSRCRVLIADDHAVVRAALRCLLETSAAIEVVAEAVDGLDAMAKIEEFSPDVAVVDVAMPKLNGIEVARRVTDANGRTRVLALSAFEDGHYVRDALAAGAAGYVPKSAAAAELLTAIDVVVLGGQYVHPRVVNAALENLLQPQDGKPRELSARETEVLRLLADGYSIKEVAIRLGVSMKTAETFKARGMEKIGGASRVDLMRFAKAQGWLLP